jgi:4-hydroxybenzoate polyprenyltransferase
MSSPPLVRALLLSCHPLPALSVTLLSAGLATMADLSPLRVVLVSLAVFFGQLSIGWSNDYLDAERDLLVERRDKPVAAGSVAPRLVFAAAVAAIVATIAFSATLGWPAGTVSVGTVLCGWLYNLRLKATTFSWLPFATAFGLLPAIATLAQSPPRWPPWWAVAAGGLLGIAAHLANVLPDLKDDIATGVRGLGQRIGERGTATATVAAVSIASTVILFGPPGAPNRWRWIAFAATLILATIGAEMARRNPSSSLFFRATILIAGIDLASFALASSAF